MGRALLGVLVDEVQHDRHVVCPEAPQGVLLGPQLAEVHAVAVHVVERPQLPRVHELLQTGHGRVVLEQVAHHQDAPRLLSRVHRALGFGHGRRERLLHETVLPGSEHSRGKLGVGGDGCGEHHGVELGVIEQVPQRGGAPHAREGARETCAGLLGVVAQPRELTALDRREVACEVGAPVAEPHNADPHGPPAGLDDLRLSGCGVPQRAILTHLDAPPDDASPDVAPPDDASPDDARGREWSVPIAATQRSAALPSP